jgi:fructokinase
VPAGFALHVAAHLASAGWRAYLVTRVGRDDRGRRLVALMERHGVDVRFVERDDRLPTGTSIVHTDGLENTFTVPEPVAWDALEGPPELPPHDVVCFGTLAGRSPRSRATMSRLLGVTSAPHKLLDVNLRPPHVHRAVIEAGLGAATAVKTSERELADVAACLEIEPSPHALIDHAPALRWVCVTSGTAGASLHERGGGTWEQDGRSVEVVDTVGAGDAFTAGFAEGLVEGLGPEQTLDRAQRRAASVLARRGGLPAEP